MYLFYELGGECGHECRLALLPVLGVEGRVPPEAIRVVQRFLGPAPDMQRSRAEVALAAWNRDSAAAAPVGYRPRQL